MLEVANDAGLAKGAHAFVDRVGVSIHSSAQLASQEWQHLADFHIVDRFITTTKLKFLEHLSSIFIEF